MKKLIIPAVLTSIALLFGYGYYFHRNSDDFTMAEAKEFCLISGYPNFEVFVGRGKKGPYLSYYCMKQNRSVPLMTVFEGKDE